MASRLPLLMDVRWEDGDALFTVRGELDLTSAPELSAQLGEVAAQDPRRLVLELSGLTFIDVSGARVFKAMAEAFQNMPAECVIIARSPRPSVRKLLQMSGLEQLCKIEDAWDAVHGGPATAAEG
jgi:anti-anti-sigma factor